MPGFTLKVQELKVGIRYLKVGMHMASYGICIHILVYKWYLITYNLTKEYKLGLDLCIGSCSQNTWNIVILWPSWSCEAVDKIARVSISTTISGKQLSVAESWSPTQTNCAMLHNIQPFIILISDSFTNHTKPTSLGEVGWRFGPHKFKIQEIF